MREDARTRGRRLIVEGRLVVQHADAHTVAATCRGDTGQIHQLGFNPADAWWCTCPARGRCAHLAALQLVTLRPIGLDDLLPPEPARG